MKRYLFAVLLPLVAILFTSCPLPVPDVLRLKGAGFTLPADTINDLPRASGSSFSYQTLLPVTVKLGVELYDARSGTSSGTAERRLPANAAVVIVTIRDQSANQVYAGRVASDGTLHAVVQLPAALTDMVLTLSANGFEERSVVIRGMAGLAEVNRSMAMQSVGAWSKSASGLTADRDGDLIPDVYDAFPDDPNAAFAYHTPADGKLTIAFEDLYGRAQAGDADYNDFIARYVVTEVADADNRIRRVEVQADAAVKLAGYNHMFGLRLDKFLGSAHLTGTYVDEGGRSVSFDRAVTAPADVVLFKSTRIAVGKTAGFTLVFDEPQQIAPDATGAVAVDRPPYNPWLYVLDTGQDIHLMGKQDLNGSYARTFQDSEGFPWALLVPTNWKNPSEGQRIEVHYPRFTLWRQSFGAEHTDWYLHYDDPYVPPTPAAGVYIAGYYNAGANDVAAYWKNGAAGKVDLYTATNAWALSTVVSAADVYVAGYYTNSKGNTAACYWKNGLKVDLYSDTSGSNNARGNAIAVSGSDVYVAGWVNLGTKTACYWKNGTRVDLSATVSDGLGMALSGADVYVAGYYTSGPHEVACYWKNNLAGKVDLYATNYARASSVAVSGSDVYVAGYYLPPAGTALACYWKNGAAGKVDLSAVNSDAKSIVVAGTDAYVGGYYRNTINNTAACYWKNGAAGKVDLYSDTVTAGNHGQVFGLFVSGAVVYAAGWVGPLITPAACYWKDLTRTDLYTGGFSVAYSIAFVN